jgi:uncharacterized membrane protein (UPF0127 family)
MRVINQTRKTILAEEVLLADTPLKRIRGLLGRDSLQPKEALVIRPCNSIHTFFMRFAIDVLFLDKEGFVLKAILHLQPFRLTAIYFGASSAVELPAGVVQESLTQPQDKIIIA